MSEKMITPPKRIFVIGPMTRGEKDPQGMPLSRHIPNLVKATEQALSRLQEKNGPGFPNWQVIPPPRRSSGIPRGVFSHIMHCDFAIADISNASPNVIYELAMLHANGTPVILIGNPIFYLNQQNCVEVADFRMTTLRDALLAEEQLEELMWAGPTAKYYNPITEFFDGVHLVNVAAAAGVATGQFYNFLRWLLEDGGMWRKYPELEDVVLLKPRSLSDVDVCIGTLEREFGEEIRDKEGNVVRDRDGAARYQLSKASIDDERHPRGYYFAYRVGNHLVDYPTPISSLQVSRQYRELGKYRQDKSVGFSAEQMEAFEQRLIDIYFEALEELSEKQLERGRWNRMVKVLSLEDAIEHLRT